MYEESKKTMLKLAVVLSDDNQWTVKMLDNCRGLDSIIRINGQTGKIELSELDYCRANDLIFIKDDASNANVWKMVEFGDCGGLDKVLSTEKTNQKWIPIKIGECRSSDVVMFKPSDSREWRSQRFGICTANGSLLCFNANDNSWDEKRLGDCRMDFTVLHYTAKPKVDIEELIKQVNANQ